MSKPRTAPARTQRRTHAERAFAALLRALGAKPEGDLRHSPGRAADLWTQHLLAGEGADLGKALGRGIAHACRTPVVIADMGVHLVCPHHLTVAFGKAHLAYLPGGRIAGLGALSTAARLCTSRFILQEQATQDLAAALVEHLDAVAAVALIEATHPCHNVPHGRSHEARAVTWGHAGSAEALPELRAGVLAALRKSEV